MRIKGRINNSFVNPLRNKFPQTISAAISQINTGSSSNDTAFRFPIPCSQLIGYYRQI